MVLLDLLVSSASVIAREHSCWMLHMYVWVCCRVRLLTLWLHFTGARCRRIAFPATRTPYFCWSTFSCCWSFHTCSRCDVVCLRPSSDKLPARLATEFVESPSRTEMSLVIRSPTFSWCERAYFVARPIFWNQLPHSVWSLHGTTTFECHVKKLFSCWFALDCTLCQKMSLLCLAITLMYMYGFW